MDFSKILQIQTFKKIRPLGADLLYAEEHTNRQTDRHDELDSRFSQFRDIA